jgi:hypothetical protein
MSCAAASIRIARVAELSTPLLLPDATAAPLIDPAPDLITRTSKHLSFRK